MLISFFLFILAFILCRGASYVVGKTWGWEGLKAYHCISTPIHEACHALTSMFFGHKITRFAPYLFDKTTGLAGVVEFTYNKNSIFQIIGLFFSAIAPFLMGGTLVIAIAFFSFSNPEDFTLQLAYIKYIFISYTEGQLSNFSLFSIFSYFWGEFKLLFYILFSYENLTSIKFFLGFIVVFLITPSIMPSRHDIIQVSFFIASIFISFFIFFNWLAVKFIHIPQSVVDTTIGLNFYIFLTSALVCFFLFLNFLIIVTGAATFTLLKKIKKVAT
ncbi:MAG: hypothetical protein RBR08_16175 [Desulforegulaceae bacterium]|nr:hypothetical protein [Desulforegulaceae bacterium]